MAHLNLERLRQLLNRIRQQRNDPQQMQAVQMMYAYLHGLPDRFRQVDMLVESGIEKYKQGNLQGAYQDFNRSIEIAPNPAGYTNRACIEMDLENLERAIADSNSAIALNPELADAYHNLGLAVMAALLDQPFVIDPTKVEDIISFAKQELRTAIELGHPESARYLAIIETDYQTPPTTPNKSATGLTEVQHLLGKIQTALINWQKDDFATFRRHFDDIHLTVSRTPSQIPKFAQISQLGHVYTIAVDLYKSADPDFLQQIATVGYLILSIGYDTLPNDPINFTKDRYLVETWAEDVFIYTVMSGLTENGRSSGLRFLSPVYQTPSTHWRRLYAMQYADLLLLNRLVHAQGFEILRDRWDGLEAKRIQGYFGGNKSKEEVGKQGMIYHENLKKYLYNRIIEKEDLDF